MSIDAFARELIRARAPREVLAPPSQRSISFSLDDGYAVGELLHQEALKSGCTTAGLKLGFTNAAVWRDLGLDSPFWARVYDRTLVETPEIALAPFVAPRIEPEIVLGFGSDLAPRASSSEISAAIAWAAVGFEIVQCHYPHWQMTPSDAIADAGLHGALLIGEHVSLSEGEAEKLAEVAVEIRGDRGGAVASGRGANALGGPLEAVTWLVRLRGVETIRAGSVVTTGSLTPALPITPGGIWELVTAGPVGLGGLRANFS